MTCIQLIQSTLCASAKMAVGIVMRTKAVNLELYAIRRRVVVSTLCVLEVPGLKLPRTSVF
jgi:hypothetical protein